MTHRREMAVALGQRLALNHSFGGYGTRFRFSQSSESERMTECAAGSTTEARLLLEPRTSLTEQSLLGNELLENTATNMVFDRLIATRIHEYMHIAMMDRQNQILKTFV